MKGLAELVVSLCDLCEAEGRLLEAGILRTVRRVGLLSLGLLFGAAALALFLVALYALLTSFLPTPGALALLGCASAVIAAGLLRSARGAPAQAAGIPKQEDRGDNASKPVEAGPASRPPAPMPARKPDQSHAPWAEVAPYGHGAGAPPHPQAEKGANPKGVAGKLEKR